MFSSKDLISFVFANENDTYYGEDLLKRDLNQYLWDRLHRNYEAVYFLNARGNSFQVSSYGDLRCNEYTPGKKKLFGLLGGNAEQTELGGWIQRQLRAKPEGAAAFVCPLDDFCSVLSDPKWSPVLEGIAEEKKRTGIFVLTASTTAEKSADLLLTSPVFEKLRESTVMGLRGGAVIDLYSTLKKRKMDGCVFLNTLSWEQVHGLLLHLAMEHPQRCESCERLDEMTEYLYAYVRDSEFARSEQLIGYGQVAGYLTRESLYTWLQNDRNWKKFEARVALFDPNGRNRSHQEWSPTNVAVLRDPAAYAGRCMKIDLPGWLSEDAAATAKHLLRSITEQVSSPKNRKENPQIVAVAEKMLNRLDAVRHGDEASYLWILEAVKFCVSQVYSSPDNARTKRVQEILQTQIDAIDIFDQHFTRKRDLAVAENSFGVGKLQNMALQQLKASVTEREKMKESLIDLVRAAELQLEMAGSKEDVSGLVDNIRSLIDNFHVEPQTVAMPDLQSVAEPVFEFITEPEPMPEPEPEPEEVPEIFITADMYGIAPPSDY